MREVEDEGVVCVEEVFEVGCGSGLSCIVMESDGKVVLRSFLLFFTFLLFWTFGCDPSFWGSFWICSWSGTIAVF